MNKLEKVALRSAPKRGRPLVLVINNIHFFQNDEAGRGMLLQLQQKAEAWAASGELGIRHMFSVLRGLTLIFDIHRYFDVGFHHVSSLGLSTPAAYASISDDFWPFQFLSKSLS